MSSWFYKLRHKRGGAAIAGGEPDDVAKPVAPAPSPCSPNRASYYVPSRERVLPPPRPAREDNPRLRDTHFPRSPQPSDIVFDVVARRDDHRFKPMPELKLRPILTRHGAASADSTSAAASPTARVRPRFHVRPPPSRRRKAAALPTAEVEEKEEACARRSRRRRRSASRLRPWMYESLVVVKDSADPEEDFLESMAEMIAANGVRSPRGLEELLACYLALNAPDHHCAIVAAFRRAWVHLHSVPPPPARGRCMHESRLI
ncbi:hypothetical protein SEVIR_2G445400v4 [Setaria viridis]|uniref:Transcription repressor n=1 Tax=Setaria viridis TaxID=4556 RepID=A0A4U6W551_SETVI|nr:transcription repressor OFP1-like [Setaria viridis]TKW36513.1 hypothetical protein SEVIR_2G445400v2 [Setaria viridis]